MILVDTNIPLRLAQIDHPHGQIALDALQLLTLRDQEQFAIASQSLYEMYVVCTRPAKANGSVHRKGRKETQRKRTRTTSNSSIILRAS